jgi:DNA-directed RNA polymerase subunit beta'
MEGYKAPETIKIDYDIKKGEAGYKELNLRRYNGKIIIPEVFAPPSWYEKTREEFKSRIKEDYKKNGMKLDTKLVKRLLKEVLLNRPNMKIKFPLNKKNVPLLLDQMYKEYTDEEYMWRYQLVYEMGFFLVTFVPSSFSPEALTLPKEFQRKKEAIIIKFKAAEKINRDKAIIQAQKDLDKLTNEVAQYFRDNDIKVIDLIDSGSKGSIDDIRKLLIATGLSINSKGEINDVILNSHTDGLEQTQFFNYSSQGIVSLYAKSTDTAIPGYLIRKLYTSMEPVVLSSQKDCGSTKYFHFAVQNEDMANRLVGRIYKTKFGFDQIQKDNYKELVGKTILLRSPLYCKAKDGVCETCFDPNYIEELKVQPKDKLGLKVVGSIAETLPNLTLKASHTGLSLNNEEVDIRNDIKQYTN